MVRAKGVPLRSLLQIVDNILSEAAIVPRRQTLNFETSKPYPKQYGTPWRLVLEKITAKPRNRFRV